MHPGPTHFPVPLYLPTGLVIPQKKTNKQNKAQKTFLHGSRNVSQCDTQCTLLSTLLANAHRSGSLMWFQASGFCYTINPGSSWDLLLVILLLPCGLELLQLWICRAAPLTCSSTLYMGQCWHSPGSGLVSSPAPPCPHHWGDLSIIAGLAQPMLQLTGGRVIAIMLMPSGPAHLHPCQQCQALLCCLGEVQGPLYSNDLRASSPNCNK